MNLMRVSIILIILSGLWGCQNQPYSAPIVDAQPIPKTRIREHVVAPGETLYSIALKYDVDYEKLSRMNGLDREYSIRPGQVLKLDLETYDNASGGSGRAPERTLPAPAKSSKNQSTGFTYEPTSTGSKSLIIWHWPTSGKVLEVFGGQGGLNKGIDIRGKLGEPVFAAADGEVVYSGSGLRGYGNLIIVKHNERYLSAYAHNRVILVREGEQVSAGQRIAEVGFSGSNVAKLHFEIRVNGKPVDPLRYLPTR